MNPYYAFSAIFALGLRGIEQKLSLPYGPLQSPGVTRDTLIKLPTSLESATETFKRKDSVAREIMGDYFVDHFAGTREHELEVFRRAVTDWEGEYFRPHECSKPRWAHGPDRTTDRLTPSSRPLRRADIVNYARSVSPRSFGMISSGGGDKVE